MKYIQKSRIETFLKSKGYKIDSSTSEKVNTNCWIKSDAEKVIVPRKDVLASNELVNIFSDTDLLNEFRRF